MNVELAVVGAPFLDLTFEGLPRVPQPGEEIIAERLHVAPGGTGMQGIAAARLGLATALIAPLPAGGAGALVRHILEAEGIVIAPTRASDADVPVTALLTTPDGVAMATTLADAEPTTDDVAAVSPSAVMVSLGRLPLAPENAMIFVVTGTLELDHVTDETFEALGRARAFILNRDEAARLTGTPDPEDAARALADRGPAAIVTLGAEGALASDGDRQYRTTAPEVEVVDATGAGDLFAAAYVWADMRGIEFEERLAWASLYASLSVRTPTALSGALALEGFLVEGRKRGLDYRPH